MSWDTAVADVRVVLSDGPTDKLRHRKKLIGMQDGTNLTFKTFEFRRITDFTDPSPPLALGIFVQNAKVTVSSDDLATGEFVLAAAPGNTDTLQGTYYIQWFIDAEIQDFLISAAEFIGFADDWTQIPEALRPAAKEYAAASAYQKLIATMSVNLDEVYQLYDAPDEKRFDPIAVYQKISTAKFKLAFQLRDDVYKNRQGRALAPISGSIRGHVNAITPKR